MKPNKCLFSVWVAGIASMMTVLSLSTGLLGQTGGFTSGYPSAPPAVGTPRAPFTPGSKTTLLVPF